MQKPVVRAAKALSAEAYEEAVIPNKKKTPASVPNSVKANVGNV